MQPNNVVDSNNAPDFEAHVENHQNETNNDAVEDIESGRR